MSWLNADGDDDLHGEEWKGAGGFTGEAETVQEPREPAGMDLLCHLSDSPALRRSIHLLLRHREKLPFWPRLCRDCMTSFRPQKRSEVRCAGCRTARSR